MITVISATNRPNSNTHKIASSYMQLLEKQGVAAKLFSLEKLSPDMHFIDLYGKHSEKFQQLLQEYIIPAEKFVSALRFRKFKLTPESTICFT